MSGTVIVDTRQQEGKHREKHEHLEYLGCRLERCKLIVGDYAPPPSVSVDTKKDIYELASDIDQDHDRFKRELVLANGIGCKLYILTINDAGVTDLASLSRWSEPDSHLEMRVRKSGNKNARRIEGLRLAKACATMGDRYGACFLFCGSEVEAANIIRNIVVEGWSYA